MLILILPGCLSPLGSTIRTIRWIYAAATDMGNRIGVEMTEWLDQTQTLDFARWEKIVSALHRVKIGPLTCTHSPFGRFCEPQER
jgi:hypothetical protein